MVPDTKVEGGLNSLTLDLAINITTNALLILNSQILHPFVTTVTFAPSHPTSPELITSCVQNGCISTEIRKSGFYW